MSGGSVLVLTEQSDPTADLVIEELNRRDIPVFRCDPAEFPQQLTMSAVLAESDWAGTLTSRYRTVRLGDVRSVYYRRPTAFQFPEDMSQPERQWAALEARAGFGGLLISLPNWLNHPVRMAYADYKPAQLMVARRCGLVVPRTLLTNDPDDAADFIDQVADSIYKPLWGTNLSEAGEHRLIYTTRIKRGEGIGPGVNLTAHLFQEWVPKEYEIRLTVVDDSFFAVAISAHSDRARVDWRSDYPNLSYELITAPNRIKAGVRRMLDWFGLRFGAFDFVVTPAGEWVFLEINPNGQWSWLVAETGAPIAAAIADGLGGKRP